MGVHTKWLIERARLRSHIGLHTSHLMFSFHFLFIMVFQSFAQVRTNIVNVVPATLYPLHGFSSEGPHQVAHRTNEAQKSWRTSHVSSHVMFSFHGLFIMVMVCQGGTPCSTLFLLLKKQQPTDSQAESMLVFQSVDREATTYGFTS